MKRTLNVWALRCLALQLLMISPAYAACSTGSKTLFSCSTANEKKIEVCEVASGLEYSFGNPQLRPEIVVRASRAQVSKWRWRSPQRWSFQSLEIPNGRTSYNIYLGFDTLSPAAALEGGVNVITGENVVATVVCVPGSIVQAIDSVTVSSRGN